MLPLICFTTKFPFNTSASVSVSSDGILFPSKSTTVWALLIILSESIPINTNSKLNDALTSNTPFI